MLRQVRCVGIKVCMGTREQWIGSDLYVAIDIPAGRKCIDQCRVDCLHCCFQFAFDDSVELECLTCCDAQ